MRIIFLVISCFTFTGCTADREFQENILHEIAQNRADIINTDLPISIGCLNINQAKSKDNTIYISAESKDCNTSLLKSIVYNQCKNKELNKIINRGINYDILIQNTLNKKTTEIYLKRRHM